MKKVNDFLIFFYLKKSINCTMLCINLHSKRWMISSDRSIKYFTSIYSKAEPRASILQRNLLLTDQERRPEKKKRKLLTRKNSNTRRKTFKYYLLPYFKSSYPVIIQKIFYSSFHYFPRYVGSTYF